ncbi:ABC transporter substrate-binding protein [Neisseria iguanae]|uniref:ABC transporter substrate-binding protein n=1 Tax=Neisseria iguanae TaxID=90242 RepID=A0A2P7TXN2_9NEIS|nr:ABC transporter substrate-binding protein [Neisseria iguanae]
MIDNNSLQALNLPTPPHTSFISSSSAQQNNPNVQLRNIDGKKTFTYDQNGLISSLEFKPNDEVQLDGVVTTNNGATQVNFTAPGSVIAKAYSGGTTKEDASTRNIAYIRKDKNGLVFDKKFDGVYIVKFTDGTQIVLHDSAAAGWTYQTFAHYLNPKNGVIHGYQSLGDETPYAALPQSGTATYNGLATAYLVQNSTQKQVTADVKAVVDFAKKGVRFETSNTHFRAIGANGFRVDTKAADYDIKANAKWSNHNQFKGTATTANGMTGELNGKFYGAGAAEIGGIYGLKNAANTEQLIGGYGAKRQ